MSNNWGIEDEKGWNKIFIGALIAFLLAAVIAFFSYKPDFIIGKILYSFFVGMTWAWGVFGILQGMNSEFRNKAKVSEKIINVSIIFYPLLFEIGWKLFNNDFLMTHPGIHAMTATFLPGIMLSVVQFIATIFDKDA